MRSTDYEIEALAGAVGPGQHTGLTCPACGDSSPDRALSMIVDGRTIKAICHRAKCGFRYSNGVREADTVLRPSRACPYTGELHALDIADLRFFERRFGAHPDAFMHIRKSNGRYFLPIVGPEGTRRGWVSRRPWEGSPLYQTEYSDEYKGSPKSLTYMDNEEPVQHWTGWSRVGPTVIVEDQISAVRVTWDTYLPAVAILGTGVNEEKVAELQRHMRHILIALDSDATGQAFSLARKWGQAFESCRVIILTADIKDTHVSEVKKIFSPYASI